MEQAKQMLKRCVAGVMVGLIAFSLVACTAGAEPEETSSESATITSEGEGFDTPEEAVEAYLLALKDADFDGMLSAFAVEAYVDNFDYEAQLNRSHVYNPTYTNFALPSSNNFMQSVNVEIRRSSITGSILQQYIILREPDLDLSEIVKLEDETAVSEFVAQLNEAFDVSRFSTLEVLGFIPPEDLSDTYMIDGNQETLQEIANVYGAEQFESCTATIQLDSDAYLLCFDVIMYNNKWYIYQMGGNIGILLSLSTEMAGTVKLPDGFSGETQEILDYVSY